MLPHERPTVLRVGAGAILAAGFLLAVSTLLRGPFVDPTSDGAAFVAWVTGPRYLPAVSVFLIAVFSQMVGVIALYRFLVRGKAPRLAFAGTLLTLATDGLVLVMIGVFFFAFPAVGRLYNEGHHEALAVVTSLGAPFLVLLALQALTFSVGTVMTSIAIARSGFLPRWCAPAYAVAGVILAFAPPVPYEVEIPGAVLYAITYAWIAKAMWTRIGAPEALAAAPAPEK
jgi:hypothetical protein